MTRTCRARCSPHWDGSFCRDAARGIERRPAPRDPARDGDVRARGRHVADERVDLGGRPRSRHDGERGSVGDRARGARLGRVHPHRQQGRRSDRPQARVHHRAARLRDRRALDDALAEPAPDRDLLGGRRRPRRVAAAAVDAVAHPRELRGRDAAAGLRARGRGGGDRGRRRAARGRLHHDLPLLAGRVRRRGRDHRDRAPRQPARARRSLHGRPSGRRRRRDPLGGRHGRSRARDPRLGKGRRGGGRAPRRRRHRPRLARVVAPQAQARRQAGADRRGSLQVEVLPPRDLLADDAADRPRRDDDRAADLPPDGARVQRARGRPVDLRRSR